jgi:hypothetical protein
MRTNGIMRTFIAAAALAGGVAQDAEASKIDTNPWPIENLTDDRYYRHMAQCVMQLPKPEDPDMEQIQFTLQERIILSQCMKDKNFEAIMNAKTIPDVLAADIDGDRDLSSPFIKLSADTKLEFITACREKAGEDKSAFRQCFSERARERVQDISIPLIVGGGIFFGGVVTRKMWGLPGKER